VRQWKTEAECRKWVPFTLHWFSFTELERGLCEDDPPTKRRQEVNDTYAHSHTHSVASQSTDRQKFQHWITTVTQSSICYFYGGRLIQVLAL